MSEESCAICGSEMNEMFSVKLPCGHEFHYECLYKTYASLKKTSYKYRNHCPYCREKSGLLPIVNGLARATVGIHYAQGQEPPEIPKVRCQHILVRGKNKGSPCDKKCQLGFTMCKTHREAKSKSSSKASKFDIDAKKSAKIPPDGGTPTV